MSKKPLNSGLLVILAATVATHATVETLADVIVFDQSPASTGGSPFFYENYAPNSEATGQNYSDLMVLSTDQTLTGVDLYLSNYAQQSPAIGESVTIRVRETDSGPILFEFTDPITLIDADGIGSFTNTVRAHVDFSTPLPLVAGNYWLGMPATSKAPFGFGQIFISGGTGPYLDNLISVYDSTTFILTTSIFDMSFRVYAAIPEPSTLALATFAQSFVTKRRKR